MDVDLDRHPDWRDLEKVEGDCFFCPWYRMDSSDKDWLSVKRSVDDGQWVLFNSNNKPSQGYKFLDEDQATFLICLSRDEALEFVDKLENSRATS